MAAVMPEMMDPVIDGRPAQAFHQHPSM